MNITTEEIKWLCDKAGEDWNYAEYTKVVSTDCTSYHHGAEVGTQLYRRIIFPLLLQRAIEGVNREGKYNIIQDRNCVFIYPREEIFEFGDYLFCSDDVSDNAKLSALRYVMEQELK